MSFDVERRRAHMECSMCWSPHAVSGRAMTPFVCERCGRSAMHSNTDVPRFCKECAQRYNMCCRCGGPVD